MKMETSLMKALENLHLADKSAVQISKPEEDYVLDMAVQNCSDDPLLAAACSNFTVQLMSRNRLTHISTISGCTDLAYCMQTVGSSLFWQMCSDFKGIIDPISVGQRPGHTGTITKVQFGKTDSNLVYTSSKDKTARCWDTRVSNSKEVQLFRAPSTVEAELLSLDISQSGRLLSAGTEQAGSDSYLLFWDTRQNSSLGCYDECHQDDITQVCFQPGSDRYLASGSADGLVCTFDLTETDEDDALQVTSNAESDVARVGWCGSNNKCVYCVTSDNVFHVWDALEGDSRCTVDCFSGASEGTSVDYIVDCIPELTVVDDRSSAVLLVGTHSGSLQLRLCPGQSIDTHTLASLNGGHTATVRCSIWDSKTQTLLTGGEDSLVCLWTADPSVQFSVKSNKADSLVKIKNKASISDHAKKPYSKKQKS